MAQDDIQGQVVDPSGNPVSGAIVELTKSFESSPDTRGDVFRTTTDSNGNYIFTGHQEGDGTTQEWHVSAYNHDGTAYVNSFNNPGVTADLPSNAIPDATTFRQPWGEGSGSTTEDTIGDNDGTINGATWQSGSDWIGGHYLSFSGDYVDIESVVNVNSDDYTLLITVEPTADTDLSNTYDIWTPEDDVDARLRLNSGIIEWAPYDGGSSNYLTGPSVSQDTRYRVVVRVNNTDGAAAMFVNGSESDSISAGSNANSQSARVAGIGRSRTDLERDWVGHLDEPLVAGLLSDTEIQDDYDRQPWS